MRTNEKRQVSWSVVPLEGERAIMQLDPVLSPTYIINGGDMSMLIKVMKVRFLF
jgi:hypothetical protein